MGHRQRNRFGQIHRRAAAERHDAVAPGLTVHLRRRFDGRLGWIGRRPVEDRRRAVVAEPPYQLGDHAKLNQAGIGAEQRTPDAMLAEHLRELLAGAMVEDRMGQETKGGHRLYLDNESGSGLDSQTL